MQMLARLVVLLGLVLGKDHLRLGDRIVASEEECSRLNQVWEAQESYTSRTVIYFDLLRLCLDNLIEDKYIYIDQNHVDLTVYPEEDAKFPVTTRKGEKWVWKPYSRNKEEELEQERLSHFKEKNEQTTIQSEKIVDQQVNCVLLEISTNEENVRPNHDECMQNLNCMKVKFMQSNNFTPKEYPDLFPILYKGKETFIDTPSASWIRPCKYFEINKLRYGSQKSKHNSFSKASTEDLNNPRLVTDRGNNVKQFAEPKIPERFSKSVVKEKASSAIETAGSKTDSLKEGQRLSRKNQISNDVSSTQDALRDENNQILEDEYFEEYSESEDGNWFDEIINNNSEFLLNNLQHLLKTVFDKALQKFSVYFKQGGDILESDQMIEFLNATMNEVKDETDDVHVMGRGLRLASSAAIKGLLHSVLEDQGSEDPSGGEVLAKELELGILDALVDGTVYRLIPLGSDQDNSDIEPMVDGLISTQEKFMNS